MGPFADDAGEPMTLPAPVGAPRAGRGPAPPDTDVREVVYPRLVPGDRVGFNGRRGRIVFDCRGQTGSGRYVNRRHPGLTRGVLVEWPDRSVAHFLDPEVVLAPIAGPELPQRPR